MLMIWFFWHLLHQPWGSCWTVVRILLIFVALSLIPPRHSNWYIFPLTLLPLALPAFFLFLWSATSFSWHCLTSWVIFFITISMMFKILNSNCATWLGKLIVYLRPFQELVRINWLNYFSFTACLYMDLVYGHSHPQLYKINKILCRIWSLPPCSHFCIVLIFIASSMSSIPILILSSLLPPSALLCLLVPSPMIPLFSVSLSVGIIPCLAVVTSKQYYVEDSSVLQWLDPYINQLLTLIDTEQIIETISCD